MRQLDSAGYKTKQPTIFNKNLYIFMGTALDLFSIFSFIKDPVYNSFFWRSHEFRCSNLLKIGLKWHKIKNNLSIFILMKNIISLQISANRNEMMLADVNGNFFHTNLINVRIGMNDQRHIKNLFWMTYKKK